LQSLWKKVQHQDGVIAADQKRIYDLALKYGLAKRMANQYKGQLDAHHEKSKLKMDDEANFFQEIVEGSKKKKSQRDKAIRHQAQEEHREVEDLRQHMEAVHAFSDTMMKEDEHVKDQELKVSDNSKGKDENKENRPRSQ
jgi:hypothetical protein